MTFEAEVYRRALSRHGAARRDAVVLSGDLTRNTECDGFRDSFPDRFFSMGLTEQNMVSFAGGLAREGLTPFVHSFAVFLYRRPFDQLLMSVAYPALPVRFMGFLPGLTTPGGVTHQAIEDLAVLRSVPNMTVLETCDATEVEHIFERCESVPGPVYARIRRGTLPRLFDPNDGLHLRPSRVIAHSGDIGIISAGITTEFAMKARHVLASSGAEVGHLHLNSIKPFPADEVAEFADGRRSVYTVENGTVLGGIGTCVIEALHERGVATPVRRLGLQDEFARGGPPEELVEEFGFGPRSILDRIAAELHLSASYSDPDDDWLPSLGRSVTASGTDDPAEGL